jgi:hypothetical protein
VKMSLQVSQCVHIFLELTTCVKQRLNKHV